MKTVILMIFIIGNLFAWEINTHRAIDRKAIEVSKNLQTFIENSGISGSKSYYNNEIFENYGTTYLTYIKDDDIGEKNGVSKWGQTFGTKPSYQKMIEAGTILEDALWQDADWIAQGGDGRFNNHFYEAQNGGHKLTYGYGFHVNAVDWVTDVNVPTANPNLYNYPRAMRYFLLGFTEEDPNERRKYQAKMLVSVGHMLHMVNDMNVPAHVRDDAHPFGDPLEVWMRGGTDGSNAGIGFHVKGNTVVGKINSNSFAPYRNNTIHKQSKVADFMTAEATFTSENFVSKDTLYLDNDTYLPNRNTTSYSAYQDIGNDVRKRYIRNQHGTKIAIELDSYLCRNIQKIYYPNHPSRRGRGLCGAPTTIKGDYTVFKESGEVLIKRAMSNAVGFLDYFFRIQLSVTVDCGGITVKNISKTSLVKDTSSITLKKSSILRFEYIKSNGAMEAATIDVDPDRPIDATYDPTVGIFYLTKDIKPGESFTIPVKHAISLSSSIIAVYTHDIRPSEGIDKAVAVAKINKPMIACGN